MARTILARAAHAGAAARSGCDPLQGAVGRYDVAGAAMPELSHATAREI